MISPAQFHLDRSVLLRRMSAIVLTLLMLSTAAIAVRADTIKLKNGSIIKGRVVGYTQGEFTVILDLGTSSRRSSTRMIIAAEDIESIEFDGSQSGSSISQVETPGNTSIANPPASIPNEPVIEAPTRTEIETANAPPQRTPEPEPRQTEPEAPATTTGSTGPLVAEKEIRIVASVDWTNTNLRVQKGHRITITSSGEVDLGKGRRSGPAGIELTDPGKLLEDRKTGALIAVIGDDNNDFIFVGRQTEFTAGNSGFLYLSVNERDLKDNGGSFIARVKISGNK